MNLSASDLLWVFVIFSMLQPVLTRKLIEMKRLAMISRLEKTRGSRVILMVHRQETMRLLGFPLMRYIDLDDFQRLVGSKGDSGTGLDHRKTPEQRKRQRPPGRTGLGDEAPKKLATAGGASKLAGSG